MVKREDDFEEPDAVDPFNYEELLLGDYFEED